MTEPTSVSSGILIATGVGLASILPGIDGDALIGAFAGGTLFVVSANQLPVWRRLIYLVISAAVGYLAAPEVASWGFIKSTGVSAFVSGALAVTVTLGLIEKSKTLDWAAIVRRGGPPRA